MQKFIVHRRLELSIAIGYGVITTALFAYLHIFHSDPWILMLALMCINFPIAWPMHRLVSPLFDKLPIKISAWLDLASMIVASVIWAFIVACVVRFIVSKLKARRRDIS